MLAKLLASSTTASSLTSGVGRRLFSRADILKSLDKNKINRKAFIKKELTENPEFFKAFPHMQAIFNVKAGETQGSGAGGSAGEDKLDDNPKYFHDQQVGFKDPSGRTEAGYFDSLMHQHNQYMTPKQKEEAIRENERNFIEAYLGPEGPSKYMSKEELEHVHSQIDKKMQELEDSGLTREEILYDKQEGIPLSDDAFFQFVKNSRSAREMLIKPGEEFTVERIIEKALRQDVGPDPTMAMNPTDYKHIDEKNPSFPIWEYKKKYRDRDPVLNPEAYFYDYNQIERRQKQFDFDQEKPATFINRPLSRAQLRRKFMRRIRKDDINWKDTAFLAKFMNETGKILNKYQSRLPTAVHRKLAKTIKHVRDMELFAHVGLLKPTDKIPVGSFVEDLEEMHKKTIDPVTGRMFLKHSLQEELSTKEKRVFGTLEERLEGAEFDQDEEALTKERILREMSLDSAGERLVPDRAQRQLMIAQAHIAERDGAFEDKAEEAEVLGQ